MDAFLAPNAVVFARVVVHDSSSVWYGSVLRGDLNKIFVGFCSNVQEKYVLHAAQLSPISLPAETFIDRFVTIGASSANSDVWYLGRRHHRQVPFSAVC